MLKVATVAIMGLRGLWVGLFAFLLLFAPPARAQVPAAGTREIYESLNALRVDPAAVFNVRQLELRRADVRISLEEGTLAFLEPLQGRITGAVFSGVGRVLSVPRDPVEKQQLARFLGAAVLDQELQWAYLRFTDDAAEELQQQLREANLPPEANPEFVARWNAELERFNPPHSLRILEDWAAEKPIPYFFAEVFNAQTGSFDVTLDRRRDEPLGIGQRRTAGNTSYYDLWTARCPPDITPPGPAFRALRYAIETSVLPDNSLAGTATISVRADRGGERMLVLELSRALSVESARDSAGEDLAFFQNEGLNKRERNRRGNNALAVVLPRAPRGGEEFALHLSYRGSVITDAGNGVVFVGERGSWYPRLGGSESFADYELTLRWPRKLRLVATGTKTDEREEGDFRIGHWRTEKPIPVAGFNLGEYVSVSLTDGAYSVEVFANRQLEQALSSRLAASPSQLGPVVTSRGRLVMPPPESLGLSAPLPSPADALRPLAKEISSSIRFYETYGGPFPYRQLSVSQVPGTFGQGWPGLLYLPTLSFLSSGAQRSAGLSQATQEHFSELVPFHEVAHQWWGDVVGWRSYRDQWINEAIANYLALLFAESQKNPEHALRYWLERYRKQLLTKLPEEELTPAELGPLVLGSRLSSSRSPEGYDRVVYSKGAWVIHMVRMMLRKPGSKNPDARFVALLRTLVTKYANRALSTDDLQRELEAVMTPAMDLDGDGSMDWFFDDWVRGTGIPRYKAEYTVKRTDSGYVVRGKLRQEGVPRGFVAPVPLYAEVETGHRVVLGTVIASGGETSFQFVTPDAPRKLVIDPHMTLLCVVE
jgi:hypothetical protein